MPIAGFDMPFKVHDAGCVRDENFTESRKYIFVKHY